MIPSVVHVSGTITGDIETRYTHNGTTVCRFRLAQTPTHWDATTRTWRDGTPIPYICTAWHNLAHRAATSLTDGTNILATGHITEIRNNTVYLTIDDLGITLRQYTTYTTTNPLTAHPDAAPPAPQPTAASQPATARPDSPPPWWTQKHTPHQTCPAPPAAPHYRPHGSAMGLPAFGSGMTSPLVAVDDPGGVTRPGGIDGPLSS
ncbi:single-stranded DNA-binding protein [Streptomyces sp. NPDC050439]|uniref:single-stranded DNA-binding protein n=1 Tax=unclassified Streptomyces TaxID=2593676 RepID=UPI00342AF506